MNRPALMGVAGGVAAEPAPPKLLVQLRAAIRLRHYSLRTETAYVSSPM